MVVKLKCLCILVVSLFVVSSISLTNASGEDSPHQTVTHKDERKTNFYVDEILFGFQTKLREMQVFQDPESSIDMNNLLMELYRMWYSPDILYADFSSGTESLRTIEQQLPAAVDANISQTCLNDTNRLRKAIYPYQNWTLPFLDSTGKPGPSISLLRLNWVGNYQQCHTAVAPPDPEQGGRSFKGAYCNLGATYKGSIKVQLGACVPDSCTEKDLVLLTAAAIQKAKLKQLKPIFPTFVTDERDVTTATIFAIVLASIIGFMMLVGTMFDLVAIQMPIWSEDIPSKEPLMDNKHLNLSRKETHSAANNRDVEEVTPLIPKAKDVQATEEHGALTKVLLAFSVYTNAKKVLSTYQPPGSLGAIHGIRFLSMSWVVLCHLFGFMTQADNLAELFPGHLKRWTFAAIANGFPSVDTFFTLSGLLTSYLTIKEMRKKSWKINWAMFYFHRFWRLTPPYMLALLMVLGLQRFMGSGALWPNDQPSDRENCENNWWTNLLYINNLVKNKEICFGHSWYLANDMQFFILSPLMIIPFYFHRLAGLASCGIFLFITCVTTGALSSTKGWPATMSSLNPDIIAGGQNWFTDYYIKPWCRIGPFIVGILAGYVLAITNGGKNLRMSWWQFMTGWLVAVASGLAVVYGLQGDISGEHMSTLGASALYNSVARAVWGACICWVIIACVAGYGGPVNTLLSWSPFVFLGKLTYMSYLVHISIITIYLQNRDALYHMTDTNLVVTYLGLLVAVNMISFVLMLAFESPMIGLERAFLRKEKRS